MMSNKPSQTIKKFVENILSITGLSPYAENKKAMKSASRSNLYKEFDTRASYNAIMVGPIRHDMDLSPQNTTKPKAPKN